MLSSLPVVTLTTRKQKATSVFLHPQSEEPEDKRSRTPLGFVLLFPSWKNVAVCRSNGCSPSTAFICRPAGGEEERCCVFSSRWKINFYSCATDCFSAAGEEEEEEGEEALEFINCRKDSVCERPRKWTLQTEGGWWGWWRMMMKVCRALCLIKFLLHTLFTLTSLSVCYVSGSLVQQRKWFLVGLPRLSVGASSCFQCRRTSSMFNVSAAPERFSHQNLSLFVTKFIRSGSLIWMNRSAKSISIWTIIYISVVGLLASFWNRGASSTLTNLYKTLRGRVFSVSWGFVLSHNGNEATDN